MQARLRYFGANLTCGTYEDDSEDVITRDLPSFNLGANDYGIHYDIDKPKTQCLLFIYFFLSLQHCFDRKKLMSDLSEQNNAENIFVTSRDFFEKF